MTEVLNQEQDMTTNTADSSVEEEGDLFADYDPSLNEDKPIEFEEESDQSSEVETDEKKEESVDPQVASSQDPASFLEIKYNKEAKSLTKDEAIEYAQKGMNYDHVLEKYNALKGNENNIVELSRLADKANMSVDELIGYLKNQWSEKELSDEVTALKQMYPNSDESLLVELAKTHINDRSNLVSQKQKESENARKQEISRQMDVFAKRYPDIDASKLDPEVYRLMKDNYTLLEAYETVQASIRAKEEKEKESLEKINRQNAENKKKSLGNMSNAGYDTDNDDFVKALFSD